MKGKEIIKEEIDVNEIAKEFVRLQKEEKMLVQKIKAKEDQIEGSFRKDKKKINLNEDCSSLRFFVTKEGEDWLKREDNVNFSMNNYFTKNNCFKKIEEKEKSNGQNININLILK
jgi:hypothetical protein